MRYRRLEYRYAAVGQRIASWPLTVWRGEVLTWTSGRPQWRPDADMCESASAIELLVDLAGIDEDAVEVQLFDDALVVEGKRELPPHDARAVFHAAGIRQGPFRLELPLPQPFAKEDVEARYERGLLRITLRKPVRNP
jgi:HSP20 family protein